MIIVFDLDGVLCANGEREDYCRAIPYPSAIAQVNRVHELGHTVVIQTARGMKQYHGDISACHKHLYKLTFDWLIACGVKFHSLYFGKVSADLYVDDRGCRVVSPGDWERNFWPLVGEVWGIQTDSPAHPNRLGE